MNKKLDKNFFICELIKKINPDIVFLTETNSIINFAPEYFSLQSKALPCFYENQKYFDGENRISIFSKFEFIRELKTYDDYTSVCGEVKTPYGTLILYGSIIGSFGGKDVYFRNDLERQKEEIGKLSKMGNVCYSGDFNISFSGFPYPSRVVRQEMNDFFLNNHLINTTQQHENSVIHIVLSENLTYELEIKSQMIPIERKISDHNLVVTDMNLK
jgi:hypothetical protein